MRVQYNYFFDEYGMEILPTSEIRPTSRFERVPFETKFSDRTKNIVLNVRVSMLARSVRHLSARQIDGEVIQKSGMGIDGKPAGIVIYSSILRWPCSSWMARSSCPVSSALQTSSKLILGLRHSVYITYMRRWE